MPRRALSKKEKAERMAAQYDRQNAFAREKYRAFTIKPDRQDYADVIKKLESVPNKLEYIAKLIRADIEKNGIE